MAEETIAIDGQVVTVRVFKGVRALNRGQSAKFLRLSHLGFDKKAKKFGLACFKSQMYGRQTFYALPQLEAIMNEDPIPEVPEWAEQ